MKPYVISPTIFDKARVHHKIGENESWGVKARTQPDKWEIYKQKSKMDVTHVHSPKVGKQIYKHLYDQFWKHGFIPSGNFSLLERNCWDKTQYK